MIENIRSILIGITEEGDVLRAMARTLPAASSVEVADDQIRAAVLAELDKQKWGSKFIRVQVEDGMVSLLGTIFDERERQAAKVVAENVPGVKAVIDQLAWVEPFSGMAVLPLEESRTQQDVPQ